LDRLPAIIIERNLELTTRDGVILRGDLYRPPDKACPTLLMRTPYGKETPMGLMVVLDPLKAASAGYSVFIQDVRGRFASDGDFTPFVNEGRDGYDTIEWIARQPWSTSRVGMYGSSYMAATQLQAATLAPPHLHAICPIGGSSDYYEGRSYRGGACERGSLLSIALFALGTGTLRRMGMAPDELHEALRELKAMLADLPAVAAMPLSDLRRTVLATCAPFFFDWLEHDAPGEFWEAISVSSHYDKVRIPALHITSWFDAFAAGTINNYRGIRASGATALARQNQCLWIGPWGHYMPRTVVNGAGRLGELDFGLNALTDLDTVQLGWFDRWLKEEGHVWRYQSPVRLFILGQNAWRDAPHWPLTTQQARLFLAAGGALESASPTTETAPDAYLSDPADPVPTHGGAHVMLENAFPQGPLNQALVEARKDILLYTSEALTQELTVIGDVELDVWISSTAPSTDVVATLTVVTPDGRSINLVDGVRRTSLAPDAAQMVTVNLGALARTFKPGERFRLRISGTNFPRYDLNPQTGERAVDASRRAIAKQLVFHDISHPSALRLPVFAGSL
jgi:putative CocE/NonD family hydrolase